MSLSMAEFEVQFDPCLKFKEKFGNRWHHSVRRLKFLEVEHADACHTVGSILAKRLKQLHKELTKVCEMEASESEPQSQQLQDSLSQSPSSQQTPTTLDNHASVSYREDSDNVANDIKRLPELPPKLTEPLKHEPTSYTTKNESSPSASQIQSPCGSTDQLNSPLAEPLDLVQEADIGTDTTAMHILFQSKLGWMCWKDTEARCVHASRTSLSCMAE
jgi:hypothetical protein